MAASLDELIHRADLDDLVRYVDAICASHQWDEVIRTRDRSRAAVDTGRQLWPIATLCNQRLALWAPAEHAARALDDTARLFMPGPVSEILAVHHDWTTLAPHLPPGIDRSLFAYERSLRGDQIPDDEDAMLDIPIAIAPWEPHYATATYTDHSVDAPMPSPMISVPAQAWEVLTTSSGDPLEDDSVYSFRRMMEPWTADSNGSARCAVVEGDIADAIGALGHASVEVAPVTGTEALATLAWAAAHGGAHGRRRGAASGRAEAWWWFAEFLGCNDNSDIDPDELGELVGTLDCVVFRHERTPTDGWGFSLALCDDDEGLSVALEAHDHL